jgi:hypothetical protein
MSRTSRFRRLAAGGGVDGTRGGGGAVVTRVTDGVADGSSCLLNSDVDDARGVTGREKVSSAVAAPTARREASAETRQQQGADVIAPRWRAGDGTARRGRWRRRGAVVAALGGGRGRTRDGRHACACLVIVGQCLSFRGCYTAVTRGGVAGFLSPFRVGSPWQSANFWSRADFGSHEARPRARGRT